MLYYLCMKYRRLLRGDEWSTIVTLSRISDNTDNNAEVIVGVIGFYIIIEVMHVHVKDKTLDPLCILMNWAFSMPRIKLRTPLMKVKSMKFRWSTLTLYVNSINASIWAPLGKASQILYFHLSIIASCYIIIVWPIKKLIKFYHQVMWRFSNTASKGHLTCDKCHTLHRH